MMVGNSECKQEGGGRCLMCVKFQFCKMKEFWRLPDDISAPNNTG